MPVTTLSKLYNKFFNTEKSGGFILIFCTILSLVLTNFFYESYTDLWHLHIAGNTLVHWINDGLMTVFFLLIGLELEREIYIGELSDVRNAILPAFAALGGMLVPAGVYFLFNWEGIGRQGAGIPMATDIAFALGVLSMLGKRVPGSLKIFLTALAVIDDLGAILIIAVLYSSTIYLNNLGIALGIFAVLLILNRLKVYNLLPYLVGGSVMWYFMLSSGVHATVTGVLLAFAIPFGRGDEKSPSYILQDLLHAPVAFVILPLFALANTAILINVDSLQGLGSMVSVGIFAGLVIGKPFGVFLFSYLGTALNISSLPEDLNWGHIFGAAMLAGIGFTMSIFITLLAFDDQSLIDSSKLAVMIASLLAGIAGFLWLKRSFQKTNARDVA
ncbi:MAG: Na+/H+ antiporter NhaA [Cyclobacteriaceae bacterium]